MNFTTQPQTHPYPPPSHPFADIFSSHPQRPHDPPPTLRPYFQHPSRPRSNSMPGLGSRQPDHADYLNAPFAFFAPEPFSPFAGPGRGRGGRGGMGGMGGRGGWGGRGGMGGRGRSPLTGSPQRGPHDHPGHHGHHHHGPMPPPFPYHFGGGHHDDSHGGGPHQRRHDHHGRGGNMHSVGSPRHGRHHHYEHGDHDHSERRHHEGHGRRTRGHNPSAPGADNVNEESSSQSGSESDEVTVLSDSSTVENTPERETESGVQGRSVRESDIHHVGERRGRMAHSDGEGQDCHHRRSSHQHRHHGPPGPPHHAHHHHQHRGQDPIHPMRPATFHPHVEDDHSHSHRGPHGHHGHHRGGHHQQSPHTHQEEGHEHRHRRPHPHPDHHHHHHEEARHESRHGNHHGHHSGGFPGQFEPFVVDWESMRGGRGRPGPHRGGGGGGRGRGHFDMHRAYHPGMDRQHSRHVHFMPHMSYVAV